MRRRTSNTRPDRGRGSRNGPAAVTASTLVLMLALGFYGYATSLGGRKAGTDYALNATFLSSNGLRAGTDVMLAGVQVGTVTSIALDDRTMLSRVRFRIQRRLRLPVDSRLSIGSSTLTSGNALMISPGRSTRDLSPEATVTDTCASTSLEQQVSQYIFGAGGAPSPCEG